MRIGLISDTHIPENAEILPAQVREAFRNVDLILHAGDIYVVSVLDEVAAILYSIPEHLPGHELHAQR